MKTISIQHFTNDRNYTLTFLLDELADAIGICGWTLANAIRAKYGSDRDVMDELELLESFASIEIPDEPRWFLKHAVPA